MEIFNKLSGHGVQILSYQEPWTASAGPEIRELMISITGWIANQYSRRLSGNTKAGLERAKANGKRLGRPPGAKDKKQRRRSEYFLRYAD
ncbi:MAG: recombinase family protein [Chloroflexi bacterium]|nr:recombinase family protein [Chloroflexota bacterium]